MRHTRIDRILYMSAAIAVVLATASVTWAKVNRRPPSMYVPGDRFGPVPELSLPEGGRHTRRLDRQPLRCMHSEHAFLQPLDGARKAYAGGTTRT